MKKATRKVEPTEAELAGRRMKRLVESVCGPGFTERVQRRMVAVMPADLTEEELARLEALPALLSSARAVRNVEAAIRELRAEYRLGPDPDAGDSDG